MGLCAVVPRFLPADAAKNYKSARFRKRLKVHFRRMGPAKEGCSPYEEIR